MAELEDGMKLLEERFGGGKDNLIALATIARQKGDNGLNRPVVRTVDACYVDGAFYAVTYAQSNKILQIADNEDVAVAGFTEMFTAIGKGENLGWVLDPKNADIRDRLRTVFAAWYDMANDESDKNCCILAVRLTRGTLNINHWEKLYFLDFVNKTCMEDGGVH